MLRMDGFALHVARSPAEAVELFGKLESPMYVAGGTDLLPNLKHRILAPRNLIAVPGAIASGWKTESGHISIGAGTRLSKLATLDAVPPLARAAGLVAGPQIRNMGTLGGNVLLDTRCLYYNQSHTWRRALGHCLKAEGTWCHVLGGPKTCVAAQSSDTVPVLLALDASIRLVGPTGSRDVRLRDLYRFDGMDHLAIESGELLVDVIVSVPGPGFRGTYWKLRTRGSIDFPQLGLAAVGRFDGDVPLALDIVVGAVNPQPKPVRGLDAFVGKKLADDAIDAIADLVTKQTRPQTAVRGDPEWRRRMAGVFARRALRELRGGT